MLFFINLFQGRRNNMPTIKKLPSGSYSARVQINGVRRSVTAPSRKECKEKILRLQVGLVEKTYPALGEAIDRYIQNRNNILSPATIRGYDIIRRCRFGKVMSSSIDKIKWQAVINSEANYCSPKTLRNAWGLIHTVLSEYGIDVKVTLPPIIKEEHAFLEPDQIKDFIRIIYGHRFELAYLLGLHGLRRSEILALTSESIRDGKIYVAGSVVMDKNSRFVEKAETKTANSRRAVPVLIPRVNELIKDSEGKLCPFPASSMSRSLDTLCFDYGFPKIGMHGLRHSFASLCYHLDLSEMETMELGGWSDISVMRKIYTHLAKKDRENAAEKLKNFFKSGNKMATKWQRSSETPIK